MMSEQYQPIACVVHDEYEIAIMRRSKLQLKWIDDNGEVHKSEVLPRDIQVSNKEEYLLAVNVDDGQELCIRLDKITLLDNEAGR
jgi:transcriptional antiterminator Rof (Rho-off)